MRLMGWLRRTVGLYVAQIFRAPVKTQHPEPPEAVTVRLGTAAELLPYTSDDRYQLSRAHLDGAFARGEACVVTSVAGKLAAYGWVAYGPTPHVEGVWVEFAPGHRYNYKSLTLPEYRGQHIRGSFGVLASLDQSHAVTHTLSFIESHNYPSVRGAYRNGGQRVGWAGYLLLFGRFVSFRTPGAARYGFAFRKAASALDAA